VLKLVKASVDAPAVFAEAAILLVKTARYRRRA
jgi:hypothetical protein